MHVCQGLECGPRGGSSSPHHSLDRPPQSPISHHITLSLIDSDPEEVKNKLVPKLTEIVAAWKVRRVCACAEDVHTSSAAATRAKPCSSSPYPQTLLPPATHACTQARDTQGSGGLSQEEIITGIRAAGVFVSSAGETACGVSRTLCLLPQRDSALAKRWQQRCLQLPHPEYCI